MGGVGDGGAQFVHSFRDVHRGAIGGDRGGQVDDDLVVNDLAGIVTARPIGNPHDLGGVDDDRIGIGGRQVDPDGIGHASYSARGWCVSTRVRSFSSSTCV